ncbi:MAG: hypothetical protein EXR91_03425 [Gemmatimonadetes bacterium]|nr:hypothetical protein [Gemmatimonadota bacterium]
MMRKRDKLTTVGWTATALALALVAGACSDATEPDALDSAINYDMAVLAADATLEDVALWSLPFGFGPVPAPGAPGGHDFPKTREKTREVTFYDAAGTEQTAYDSLTTDVIHILHNVEGEVTRDGWTVLVERERDKTVSGLAGTETHRTWNGTGSEHVSRSGFTLEGKERSYDALGAFTHTDVVVPIPGSVPRYPVSGTITRALTVTLTGPNSTRTRTVDVVITFDGTSTATAVVNGVTRQIDLTARDGRFPLR